LARQWNVKSLPSRVVEIGRSGCYLRVLNEGSLVVGTVLLLDPMRLSSRVKTTTALWTSLPSRPTFAVEPAMPGWKLPLSDAFK